MTGPMTLRFGNGKSFQITPRWAGSGLAVHKPVIIDANGELMFSPHALGVWALTHIPSGYSAGRFYGNLTAAIRFARKWDAQFAAVATSKLPKALKESYMRDLAVGSAGPSKAELAEARS
jgi:hypothetical protein